MDVELILESEKVSSKTLTIMECQSGKEEKKKKKKMKRKESSIVWQYRMKKCLRLLKKFC